MLSVRRAGRWAAAGGARAALAKTPYSASARVRLAYKEPPHLVDTEADVDPKQIKFPYLEDDVRLAIYKRHKENPEEWSISRLAQHYGATIDRVKAIIFLMRKREEVMVREKVADIPQVWHDVWKRHQDGLETAAAAAAAAARGAKGTKGKGKGKPSNKESEAAPAVVAAAAPEPAEATSTPPTESTEGTAAATGAAPAVPTHPPNSKEALASEFSLTVEQVTEILDRMKVHVHNKQNVEAAEAYYQHIKSNLSSAGVDTSFRETATAPKRGSIQEDYYPTLFGDDGFEVAKKDLLSRITAETKAEIVEFEESLFSSGDRGDTVVVAPHKPMEIIPNKAGVKTDTLSRWKFAFRDLSWRRTQPTMVRSRRGEWRQANALEDALRSWRKHPTNLDLQTYREEVNRFADPDKDEAEASLLHVLKTKVRKEKRSAAAASDKK